MTSKNVNLGIEKLVERKADVDDLLLKSWRDLRNKLDSLLIGNNVLKSGEIRKLCQQLDGMTTEDRNNHITTYWGSLYAEKSMPLLLQIESVEKTLHKLK